MAEQEEHDIPRIPESELSEFAHSLFGHLYHRIHMSHYRASSSRFFSDSMVRAVLCLRNATRDVNSRILNECGYGVDKVRLCQEVCNLYPHDMYFKKLYYVTGFILEMMHWWYEGPGDADLSLATHIWQTIFRINFESEFESEGGWDGLQQAAEECYVRLLDGILPSENRLPEVVSGVVARVRSFTDRPQPALSDEAKAALERLPVRQMEIDDDSSDESMPSEEGIEKNQPGKVAQVEESKDSRPGVMDDRPGPSGIGSNVAQVEESKEESQPGVMDDRPGPSGIGGNVAQTEHLGESSAGKSGEDVLPSLGDKNTRKRKLDSPSKTDSKEESDSPSKPKKDKKDSKV